MLFQTNAASTFHQYSWFLFRISISSRPEGFNHGFNFLCCLPFGTTFYRLTGGQVIHNGFILSKKLPSESQGSILFQSSYSGYTPARKRANEKYNAKFHEVKVRMDPERHEMVKKHAQDQGESTSAFINRAIDEAIERDNQK